MEQQTIKKIAWMTALVPAVIIVWSHTIYWPSFLSKYTDVYVPQGPRQTFADIGPSHRTAQIEIKDGVVTRPVIGSPVYFLFQPRIHTKNIIVTLKVRGSDSVISGTRLGYRTGDGPESNVQVDTEVEYVSDGTYIRGVIPLERMYSEKVDARRIVIDGSMTDSERLFVDEFTIAYE